MMVINRSLIRKNNKTEVHSLLYLFVNAIVGLKHIEM